MTAQMPEPVSVNVSAGHIEVDGMSLDDVERAIALYQRVTHDQVEARSALSSSVNQTFLEHGVSLISDASQKQVRRSAALRERLLQDEGFETNATLAAQRGSSEAAVRTWISRQRERRALFTVELQGRTVIPAVQLTPDGRLRPHMAELLGPLLAAGIGGWDLWAWLTSPTSRLSGDIPEEVAAANPRRAAVAAERYAEDLRLAQDNVA